MWNKDEKEMRDMSFLRLNCIESYNHGMGGVDIADQLRLQYRPERWMRQPKWWWSIFLWALGVAVTNAYVLYCKIYDREVERRARVKKKFDCEMSPKLTHFGFLEKLGLQLIWPEDFTNKDTCAVSITSSTAGKKKRKRKS